MPVAASPGWLVYGPPAIRRRHRILAGTISLRGTERVFRAVKSPSNVKTGTDTYREASALVTIVRSDTLIESAFGAGTQ